MNVAKCIRWQTALHRWALLALVCFCFGSGYVALRVAVSTLPPFLMSGTRYFIAGILLYYLTRHVFHAPPPTKIHWRSTALLGIAFFGSNGGISWAQQMVPAGLAALLMAIVPAFVVLLEWAFTANRPRIQVLAGLVLGCGGTALLIGPGAITGNSSVPLPGLGALLLAALSMALSFVLIPRLALPSSSLLGAAMQITIAGALMLLAAWPDGEFGRLPTIHVSVPSMAAFGYLLVLGTLGGFAAHFWLIRNWSPTIVSSTSSYTSPILSVLLGSLLLGEALNTQILLSGVAILAGLALITRYHRHPLTAGTTRSAKVEAAKEST